MKACKFRLRPHVYFASLALFATAVPARATWDPAVSQSGYSGPGAPFTGICYCNTIPADPISPSFASGLLNGGGFEDPIATAGLFLDGQSPIGWTNTGVGGPVDIISAGYFGAAADSGNQFVDLIGGGEGTLPSGITQTVQLLAGQLYEFKFAYNGGGNPTPGVAEVLEYSVGDLVTGTIDTSALQVYPQISTATPWHQYSAEFTPTQSGAYPVTFKTSAGSFAGPFVDSVRLAAVVPEPSTFLLAGLAGFFAMAFCWRRR